LFGSPSVRWSLAIIFVILSAFNTYSVTGKNIFDPTSYSLNFYEVYSGYQDFLRERQTTTFENLLLLFKLALMPAAYLLLVMSFRREMMLFYFLIFPILASSLARGTDKETFDLVFYLVILVYYHGLLKKRFLPIAGMIILVFMLFNLRKIARFEGIDLHCLPASKIVCFDFNNWISVNVSPGIEFLRIMFSNYLTQGYEGLAHAFGMPFEFTWGFGHMLPVKQKICEISGVLCEARTYMERLPEYGWDTRFKWASAYTAIASDFHWTFVPFYTFVLGTIHGASEKAWRRSRDSLSLACLLLIALFIVYSSANMQLTVSLEWSFVYLTVLGWQIKRLLTASSSSAAYSGPRNSYAVNGAMGGRQ